MVTVLTEADEAADLGLPPRGFSLILSSRPVREGSIDPEISTRVNKRESRVTFTGPRVT